MAALVLVAVLATVVLAGPPVSAALAGTWTLRTEALDDAYTFGQDINDEGAIVGRTSGPSGKAFLRDASGHVTALGTLGGSSSIAWALNDAGVVVGESTTPAGTTHAFSWTSASGMVDLGTLGGPSSVAHDINRAGLVVGEADVVGGERRAVFWDPVTGIAELATPTADKRSRALGVNDAGVVVGAAGNGLSCCGLATVWDSPVSTGQFLPNLSAGNPLTRTSAALAVNDAGTIVGFSATPLKRAVRWPDHNTVDALDDVSSAEASATSISDDGTIVGNVFDTGSSPTPFVVEAPGAPPVMLPTLGGEAAVASINDHRVAVGGANTYTTGPSIVLATWTFTEAPPTTTSTPATSTTSSVPPVAPASPAQALRAAPNLTG